MSTYIDFSLSYTTFNDIIDCLERLCELSDDYIEIERYFCLITNLNRQKNEYITKENKALIKEFGLDKN